jgi:dTDP-L-rhamnose 4-epimerase
VPLDIGSGQATTIMGLATLIADIYSAPAPAVNGKFRDGDVRHASCTIEAAELALDWRPEVMVEEGVQRLCRWIDETRG